MMTGRTAIGSVAALLVSLSFGAAIAEKVIEPSSDTRQPISLSAGARAEVLAEMRAMLRSVDEIVRALATNDLAAIENAARSAGLANSADVDSHIEHQLPEAFREMGVGTHRAFDAIADQAKAGAKREEILKALGHITPKCVACHASYRVGDSR